MLFWILALFVVFVLGFVIGAENPTALKQAEADLTAARAEAQKLINAHQLTPNASSVTPKV